MTPISRRFRRTAGNASRVPPRRRAEREAHRPIRPRKENAMCSLSMRLPNEKHVSSVSHDPRVLRSVNASGLERLTAAMARKARAPLGS
jgi:hypothetical protein